MGCKIENHKAPSRQRGVRELSLQPEFGLVAAIFELCFGTSCAIEWLVRAASPRRTGAVEPVLSDRRAAAA